MPGIAKRAGEVDNFGSFARHGFGVPVRTDDEELAVLDGHGFCPWLVFD